MIDITLCEMDIRRSPTSAPLIHRVEPVSNLVKTVTFKLYTGDLWIHNPKSHIWVMMDGLMDSRKQTFLLKGRGITIGHSPLGMGIGFEHFGERQFMVGEFTQLDFLPNEFYDFTVTCDKNRVRWEVEGDIIHYADMHEFSMEYPSFDTVVGVAGDAESSTYGFFNVRQVMA